MSQDRPPLPLRAESNLALLFSYAPRNDIGAGFAETDAQQISDLGERFLHQFGLEDVALRATESEGAWVAHSCQATVRCSALARAQCVRMTE